MTYKYVSRGDKVLCYKGDDPNPTEVEFASYSSKVNLDKNDPEAWARAGRAPDPNWVSSLRSQDLKSTGKRHPAEHLQTGEYFCWACSAYWPKDEGYFDDQRARFFCESCVNDSDAFEDL